MKLLSKHEELILLTVLRLQDNAYLVTIKDELERLTGIEPAFGTIHVSLKRLQKEGLLNVNIGTAKSKRGGKAIKYYRITKQGVLMLEKIREVQTELYEDFDKLAVNILKVK